MATHDQNELDINNETTNDSTDPKHDEKISVGLTGVAKTLLIPLLARSYDNELPSPILDDPYAKVVLEKISFNTAALTMSPMQNGGIAMRTRQFDQWTESFLQINPNATVLHLACGFDSRMQRVEWGQNTRWIDIDLPEVIELRRKIQPTVLSGRDYSLLGADVLNENWIKDIDSVSGPVMVVMEGLLAYFAKDDAEGILQRICRNFSGGEMIFEGLSSAALKVLNEAPQEINAVRHTGTLFKSSIDDPIGLEDLYPGLKLLESIPVVQAPGVEKLSLYGRMLMYFSSWFPSGRDSARFLRFKF